MRNKILLSAAVLLLLIVIVVRYQYGEKLKIFKASISQYENSQLNIFRNEKERRSDSIAKNHNEISHLFNDQFSETNAVIAKDTTFSFLYLSETIKYKFPTLEYINCLEDKCNVDHGNEESKALIANKERTLEKAYGTTFLLWYPKLKDEKILKKDTLFGGCLRFFPKMSKVVYDENIWNEFEKFMNDYIKVTSNVEEKNKNIRAELISDIRQTRNRLQSKGAKYFDSVIEARKDLLFSTSTQTKRFDSSLLGTIQYDVDLVSYNKVTFENIAAGAFRDQWMSNSLNTGAMPYSYCFGSSNYCGSDECSKIAVTTGSSDVLVTVKDENADVVRHAYINGGSTFTFNVPDGQYQVFFYSGSGWNPDKFMANVACGKLRGGFVSNENFSKDDYFYMHSQIMRYQLILQQNGNLSTQPSSSSEAF